MAKLYMLAFLLVAAFIRTAGNYSELKFRTNVGICDLAVCKKERFGVE